VAEVDVAIVSTLMSNTKPRDRSRGRAAQRRQAVTTDALERLRQLTTPATTAVLTMELQRGVVGDGAILPVLRDQCLADGTIANAAALCRAARDAGARVVHCTMEQRADGAGFVANCKIFGLGSKQRAATGQWATQVGTPGAELLAELDVGPSDVVVSRIHGMTPFMSTSLDQVLRNMGVRTVIATGVSVNLGILGLALNAVDLGYQVVVARDAVSGVPAEYAAAVIDNSLSMLATIATTEQLMAAWSTAGEEHTS
jgi:nicotinamidase-related amidase